MPFLGSKTELRWCQEGSIRGGQHNKCLIQDFGAKPESWQAEILNFMLTVYCRQQRFQVLLSTGHRLFLMAGDEPERVVPYLGIHLDSEYRYIARQSRHMSWDFGAVMSHWSSFSASSVF